MECWTDFSVAGGGDVSAAQCAASSLAKLLLSVPKCGAPSQVSYCRLLGKGLLSAGGFLVRLQ